MKYLVTNDELTSLRQRAAASSGPEALRLEVEVAWFLRERDTDEAARQIDRLSPLLSPLDPRERASALARLALVRATAHLLFGRLPVARDEALATLHAFESLDDRIGMCDALALVADAENGLGRTEERTSISRRAATIARLEGDTFRADLFDALEALHQGFAGLGRAEATWRPFIDQCLRSDAPALRQHALDYAGNAHFARSEFLRSIDCYLEAARLAESTGQTRRRLISLSNAGINCHSLGDFEGALRFHGRSLSIARETRWPQRIGASLMLCAQAQLALGNKAAARSLADEASVVLAPLDRTQPYLGLQQVLGEIAMAEGNPAHALEVHRLQEQLAIDIGTVFWQTRALLAQAKALDRMGNEGEALTVAASALALARLQAAHGLAAEVLQCIAAIHARLRTPSPAGSAWASASAQALHDALDLLSRIDGQRIPASLLTALADEHARLADDVLAADFAQRAQAARAQEDEVKASHRALSAQLPDVERKWLAA